MIYWKIRQDIILLIPLEAIIMEFYFGKFGCCKTATLPQKSPPNSFSEFGELFQNRHREQLLVKS